MRTTLKRGVGRGHVENGNGKMQLPPAIVEPIAIYRQPEPPRRSRRSLAFAILGWAFLVVAVAASGVTGGAYLYLHETVAAVAPKSADVKVTARRLDLPVAGQPATALVIGYDRRADEAKNAPSRSDTLMLVRVNPKNDTISLLSFPRDLRTELVCPGGSTSVGKINAAYANCGAQGALETVRKLTGVPINYLITVNFSGFRQLVDKLGGIWMDIDRRYLNTQGGPTGYATINLQPGYQRLGGYQALDFVRFRHTDSDLYRNARQQLFVRSLKDQVRSGFSLRKLPQVIKVLTSNIEVAQGGGKNVTAKTVLSYAVLAYSLPPGHVFQSRIDGLEGFSDLTTSQENISAAVREWANPDVESPKKATAVALGEKVKTTTPSAKETPVTVLNGNGVTGSASNASYLLGQRGYPILTPPNGIPANAPNFAFFRTIVYFDPAQTGIEGVRAPGGGAVRVGRRQGVDAGHHRARQRRDAHRRRRTDLPRNTRVRARRPDTGARAGQRHPGGLGCPRAPARAQVEGRLPADGADHARELVVDRSGAADPRLQVQERRRQQEDRAIDVQDGLERLLGRPAVQLGRRTRAR